MSRPLRDFRAFVRWLMPLFPRRLLIAGTIPVVLLTIGTLGYRLIEGPPWTFFDGFYMTAITLTTIGYGEIPRELSVPGRVFTVVLAFGGIFTLFYFSTELVRGVVTGELQALIGRKRVDQQIAGLSGHVIVCGLGRMGRIVCDELDQQGKAFVVVERSNDLLGGLRYAHGLPLVGDATTDDTLRAAGIDRARALITVVASDADNLYITLSARILAPKLQIIARAEEEEAEVKLRKVGANKVISPYLAGGHRAVQAVFKPTVLHFMEMAARPEFLDLSFEEITVSPKSVLAGKTIREANLAQDLGVMLAGILRPNGEVVYAPGGGTLIEPGAVLIALGQQKQLNRLDALAKGTPG
jgi:voltage-gated potassium channel